MIRDPQVLMIFRFSILLFQAEILAIQILRSLGVLLRLMQMMRIGFQGIPMTLRDLGHLLCVGLTEAVPT